MLFLVPWFSRRTGWLHWVREFFPPLIFHLSWRGSSTGLRNRSGATHQWCERWLEKTLVSIDISTINIHKPVRELGVIFCPQLPQLVEKTELENHQPQLILEGDLLLPVQWLLLHWRWLQARQGLKISAVFWPKKSSGRESRRFQG